MYFDLRKTLSYNALYNIILGGRGIGKTFACKEYAISRFLRTKRQFVYLRRYEREINETAENYFSDVLKIKYPMLDMTYKGGQWLIEDEVAGFALTLSRASTYKSGSFPDVETIIFDEFIIEDSGIGSHYLTNEPFKVFDIFETVCRMRDNCRLFMLGNAISMANPYFLEWDLELSPGKNMSFDGLILLQVLPPSPEFIQAKESTRFGQLARRMGYAEYSLDNNFYMDTNVIIQKKTNAHFLTMVIKYGEKEYGLWCNRNDYTYLFSNDFDPGYPIHIDITKVTEGHKSFLTLSGKQNPHFARLRKVLQAGNFGFESQKIRGELKHVIAKML